MKVKYSITREALKAKDYKRHTKTKSGVEPKARVTDTLAELLKLLKKS